MLHSCIHIATVGVKGLNTKRHVSHWSYSVCYGLTN